MAKITEFHQIQKLECAVKRTNGSENFSRLVAPDESFTVIIRPISSSLRGSVGYMTAADTRQTYIQFVS
jgi:hypothetical protein